MKDRMYGVVVTTGVALWIAQGLHELAEWLDARAERLHRAASGYYLAHRLRRDRHHFEGSEGTMKVYEEALAQAKKGPPWPVRWKK